MPTLSLNPSKHLSSRNGAEILAAVVHSTVGSDSLLYLIENSRKVSAHALIRKDGHIYRMVSDSWAAHHVGGSQIRLRQRTYGATTKPTNNQVTLGIELENWNNGKDPYPDEQIASLGWLLVDWLWRYPDIALLKHRDIDTTGKSDPFGLTWNRIYMAMAPWYLAPPAGLYRVRTDTPVWTAPDAYAPIAWGGKAQLSSGTQEHLQPLTDGAPTWLHWPAGGFVPRLAVACVEVTPPPPEPPAIGYSEHSAVMQRSFLPRAALRTALVARCTGGHYADERIAELADAYADIEEQHGGPCAWLAAAQMCHETGNLTSARSAPPQRNLAGIGATNDGAAGVYFPSLEEAARAQAGRLVAYALPPGDRFGPQVALVDEALRWRPLPLKCHGSAPYLYLLGSEPNTVDGCGWAHPGPDYGRRVADVANALVRLAQ